MLQFQINIDNADTVLKELSLKGIFAVLKYRFFGFGELDNLGYCKMETSVGLVIVRFTILDLFKQLSNPEKTAKKCEVYQALCKHCEIVDEIAAYKQEGEKYCQNRWKISCCWII